MSSSYGGGGSKPHPLYAVYIDEALQRNDPNELKDVVKRVRDWCIQPMYAVAINKAIESGASKEELEQLYQHAQSVAGSDLKGAIDKLKKHLGK